MTLQNGSLRLFQAAGIEVFVHWSWLLVAFWQISARKETYSTPAWMVVEYVTLFGIVLMHEFGHALACRQVGGRAERIMLWPLGGIAYVAPPPRPGPVLWSIAAGPLVNLVLFPITVGVAMAAGAWAGAYPDLQQFLYTVAVMNFVLLALNLLPIYPLDGGQILQALLWFVVGRAVSLLVVSVIGLVAGLGLVGVALFAGDIWLAVLAGFIALRSLAGFQQGRALARLWHAPRRVDAACPSCAAQPPRGTFWGCGRCRRPYDVFEHRGGCPYCHAAAMDAQCVDCHRRHALGKWFAQADVPDPATAIER